VCLLEKAWSAGKVRRALFAFPRIKAGSRMSVHSLFGTERFDTGSTSIRSEMAMGIHVILLTTDENKGLLTIIKKAGKPFIHVVLCYHVLPQVEFTGKRIAAFLIYVCLSLLAQPPVNFP
jgi:hypothetical protein